MTIPGFSDVTPLLPLQSEAVRGLSTLVVEGAGLSIEEGLYIRGPGLSGDTQYWFSLTWIFGYCGGIQYIAAVSN